MRVLVVHEVNYLTKIIYEFQILPEMLSILGHEVAVIDYDDTWASSPNGNRQQLSTQIYTSVHRAYPEANVTVIRPGMIRLPALSRISAAITSGMEINRWLAKHPVDAVLLYGLPTVGVQTLLAAHAHSVPVMFRSIDVINQLVPWSVLVPPTRLLESFLYKRVDAIASVTMHLKKHIHSYGVPERRVRVLPSGVDAEMFSPGPRNDVLMSQWGIAPGNPMILFMGTIYRFSGLDRVIEDFPRLLSRHPDAKLLVVGCGEDEERLKKLTSEAGLSKSVIFGGLQPYAALPDIIRSSDVCINPFELNGITRDILPTKLFQYLACGKPVVATSLPGTLPFLEGERHGMIYVELPDFVRAVGDLLDSPARRTQLGKHGIAVCQGTYDWKRIAETMAAWMSEMTA